jgi:hypothetical protein
MPFHLILNNGREEKAQEYDSQEQAFDAAEQWIHEGYIARITDREGTVKYTQTLAEGLIVTYPGDATQAETESHSYGHPQKPWWKFW